MRPLVLLITSQSVPFVRIFAENFQAIQCFSLPMARNNSFSRLDYAYGEWTSTEVGTHQQLLARKGLYYALYTSKMHQQTKSQIQKLSNTALTFKRFVGLRFPRGVRFLIPWFT